MVLLGTGDPGRGCSKHIRRWYESRGDPYPSSKNAVVSGCVSTVSPNRLEVVLTRHFLSSTVYWLGAIASMLPPPDVPDRWNFRGFCYCATTIRLSIYWGRI